MATTTVPWAQEFACYGNRVGAIALGMVETLMTAGMNQTALEAFVQQIPTAVKGGRALVDDHLGQLD